MTARLESTPSQPTPPQPRRGPRGLASSAAVMASGTLVSRVLGLLRNALLVAVVGVLAVGGTGSMADAWSVANKLPNIISMLLAGGILNAVLVPQVVRAMRRRDGGQEHVNRLLTFAIAVLAGITLVLTAAATLLITLYAGAFPPEWKAVAVALAYWCIPQLFFYGLYTLLGQVLNARSIFGPYMWAPVINNVVAIAGLVAFLVMFGSLPDGGVPASAWTADRITLLAGTATLGVIAQALVLIIPLYRSGFRFKPVWGVRGHGLGRASKVATWAFAALAVGQVGYLAVSNVAAAASAAAVEGGESIAGNFAYDNAFLIFMLPQSLVTVSLVTALFTRVSQNAAARDGAKVRDDLSFGLRTLGIFTVVATAAIAVLAIPLVQVVLLDRADFGAYRAVAAVLVAMAFGLVSMGVWTMVQRVFYAYEDTRTLFRIQLPMAIILAVVAVLGWWLLEPRWWVVGTGVATTISNSVGALVGYLATRKYLPSLDGGRVFRTHLRVLLAVIPPTLAAWGLLHLWGVETSLGGAVLRLVVLGTLILGGYLLLIRALHVSELGPLLARVRGPINRVRRLLPGGRSAGPPSTMSQYGGPTGRDEQDVNTDYSVTLRPGEVLAERFQLEHPVDGPAGTGAVWSGTDLALDAPVRLLMLEGPQRDHTVDAARRAALIDDPRLVRILRAGIEGGQGFVVTDPVEGITLADLLRAGPLAPSQARAIVGEAAAALETARRRGVHHLTLRPSSVVRTYDGEVRLLGLGTDAAWQGIEVRDGADAARRDAVGLVHLLYAALTGTWAGAPENADGLPAATMHGESAAPAGDVVEAVPNDLDTLCAVTLGEHEDGPFTPGELVADLAPWGEIDQSTPAALPPVLRPGVALPEVASVEAAGAEPAAAAPAPPVRISAIDTSGWAPHPLPMIAEPTPFSDLVTDTGSIPAYTRPHHAAAGYARAETSAALPLDAEATAIRDPEATVVREPEATAIREPEATVTGDPEATLIRGPEPIPVPDETTVAAEAGGAVEGPWAETPDEEEAEDTSVSTAPPAVEPAPVEPSAPIVSIAGLPTLTRQPRGWDAPGGDAPERLPDEPLRTGADDTPIGAGPESEPASEERPDETSGLGAVVGLGAAARTAKPLRGTNRRINEVSVRVGDGARGLIGGAGERLGSLTERAGAFVDDVRDEFRPVPDETSEDGRPRFNPAPIALCVMIALVIFALVMAVLTLKDASTAFTPGPSPGAVDPSPTEPATEPSVTPTTEAPVTEDPEGPPVASQVAIAEGVTFDPTVTGGENQESAYLAYDGNADTTWNSLRYNSPTYGMKPGLGYTVVLAEAALVSSVTLDVNGEGGMVEIRLGDPAAPNQGAVLASGAMGSNVTYTFAEPVEAEAISLWFPELPVASSDGRNRIELAEITLG
ncbi:murein biosynthesis integral membrane protein MurJ [Pseudactinotalea terrae]|uniref:murein biosynthesis integral membrane protein MurJ n=1 Tax=Pseudactinotalea terrae TaxID=1743262 RepID=UPI0012E2BC81|nr:murein biosynthesis integral membrane protein MurJ [Pseudactinotalea terrae]